MQYVASLSYGKDSLACLGAIEQLGWPLDRIVHAEVAGGQTMQTHASGWIMGGTSFVGIAVLQ